MRRTRPQRLPEDRNSERSIQLDSVVLAAGLRPVSVIEMLQQLTAAMPRGTARTVWNKWSINALLLCHGFRNSRLLNDLSLHKDHLFHPVAVVGLGLTGSADYDLGRGH